MASSNEQSKLISPANALDAALNLVGLKTSAGKDHETFASDATLCGYDLPTLLEKLERALAANRESQASLRNQLRQIKDAQERKSDLLERLDRPAPAKRSAAKRDDIRKRRQKYSTIFVDPNDGSTPDDNMDTEKERNMFGNLKRVDILYKVPTWSGAEKRLLEDSVVRQNKMKYFNRQTGRVEVDQKRLSEEMEDLDWEIIAGYVGTRTAKDCLRQWTVNQHPLIAKNRVFTEDELEKLDRAVAKYKGRNWDEIAAEVGNGRVAIQCLRAYQTRLKPHRGGAWTDEEDAQLRTIVAELRVRPSDHGCWTRVASRMVGRTRKQCRQRWEKISAARVVGPWTQEEDEQLLRAVATHSGNGRGKWTKVAAEVPTREPTQCRERYERCLKPDVKRGPWTTEEYERLRVLAMATLDRRNWAQMAAALGRADSEVKSRYRILEKKGYFNEPPGEEALKYLKLAESKAAVKRERDELEQEVLAKQRRLAPSSAVMATDTDQLQQ
ncbi:uncharacterized protein SPPG_01202 [Spizellomyces punctatus DAOM BR117]|uniref:Uncharacterized protein n=1 Tax=Spizellomyces punctatus (strain DAOM BR117) TaxID=645134 RepID=A0A0L0HQT7_SPIPD|nr:uncharacterized protein SPPG_01202 [Spizellomyces punctatus DAOM BR117]KND03746.1 hypothetical protein SPPG_01202 [Spizellomyces punctatus DAOM BR117]|eukprot:XP_016611785.1 hypothetical protein SPPG_01202 [Spizellomyces punctatus DAOM BR117]